MKFRLNPIAYFISSLVFATGYTYAGGGSNGSNGSSAIGSSTINLVIINENAKPGGRTSDSPGGNAGDIVGVNFSYGNTTGTRVTITGTSGGGGQGGIGPDGGGAGSGGNAGASVIGGLSSGGAGGYATSSADSSNGGQGGSISEINLMLNNILLDGSGLLGGQGRDGFFGGGGVSGHGGGSVFGGISIGGSGGYARSSTILSSAGSGGSISDIKITLDNIILNGLNAKGGNSIADTFGSSGVAGFGGGSVFGGISTGGAGGQSTSSSGGISLGGDGGDITDSTILITGSSSLTGGEGGQGGDTTNGSGGAGGHGGGSVFGGVSTGGAGGRDAINTNGGAGGNISGSKITLANVTLDGSNAAGGKGGDGGGTGAGGAGGHGGGAVFGGISTGGAGGISSSEQSNGGDGGSITNSNIYLSDFSTNSAPLGGQGGTGNQGAGSGATGWSGGSVFGGISTGGSGGAGNASITTNGGAGGAVSNNKITLSGVTNIAGDVYGGISQGGAKGSGATAIDGKGGYVTNNTVTIIGDIVSITGSLYGGLSIDGDGSPNLDADYSRYYAGNTLVMQSGDFQLNGSIKNFQNYNWLIPQNELNGDVIITVVSGQGTAVDISNTVHSVDVQATGNVLNAGDQVTLITDVVGQPTLKPTGNPSSNGNIYIEQGFFIVYDAEMVTQSNGAGGNALVLNVLGVRNGPDGMHHPESEEFLKGRMAQLAMVDQGADMISDGISYARASLRKSNANLFALVDGGSNKYKNGGVSSLKLNDFKFALGAAKAWELENKSAGMIAAFAEHGNGNFSSYNYFDYFEDTRASGKVRYNGVGLMAHMAVANTDVSIVKNKPNIFDDKYGLYLDAALRVGHVKVDFHSADMVNGQGVEARYNTKSRYASAMLGAGYVWTLDEKSAMDFYARYTYSRLNGKDVQVVDEQMNAGAAHSKRLRLGARYGYAYSSTTTPYAGLAFERNFTGDVTGSAYGLTIKETSLKGNTGMLEAGVMIKPKGADDPFSLRLGIQGYFGQRKGATADIRARYVF